MSVSMFVNAVRSVSQEHSFENLLDFAFAEAVAAANPHIAAPSKKSPLKDTPVTPLLSELFKKYDINIEELKKAGLLKGEGPKSLQINADGVMKRLGEITFSGMIRIYASNFLDSPYDERNSKLETELNRIGAIQEKAPQSFEQAQPAEEDDKPEKVKVYNIPKLFAYMQQHEKGQSKG